MLCPSPKRRFRPTTDVSRCNSAPEQLKCFLLLLKSIFTLLLADLVSGALNIHFAANDYFEFGVVQFALCLMRSIPQDGGARLSRTVPVLSTRMSSETRHSFYSICISLRADHPFAGSAKLAQLSRRHCDPRYRRHPNQTFGDGRHRAARFSECLLWVKLRTLAAGRASPFYPRKLTSPD
jgi:hypothetical protein